MMVCAFTGLAAFPFTVAYPLLRRPLDRPAAALPLDLLHATLYHRQQAPQPCRSLTPNQMRGFASAVLIFVVTIIGLELSGPRTIALVTDYVSVAVQ